jgi:nicotinamidase-related amidase
MNIDPSKTIVLALHFERDVVAPEGPFGAIFNPMAVKHQVVEHTASVLEAARAGGATVAYARVVFGPGHPGLEPTTPLYAMVLEHNALVDGSPGAEIVDELAPQEGDTVIDHVGMSAFVGGELDRLIAERGIDTVVVSGVATNVIVEGTARDAANRGLSTYVLGDCCSAADDAAHDASIATLGLITNGITTSDELVQAIQQARV